MCVLDDVSTDGCGCFLGDCHGAFGFELHQFIASCHRDVELRH